MTIIYDLYSSSISYDVFKIYMITFLWVSNNITFIFHIINNVTVSIPFEF